MRWLKVVMVAVGIAVLGIVVLASVFNRKNDQLQENSEQLTEDAAQNARRLHQ